MECERRYNGWKHCFFCTLTYDETKVPMMDNIDTDTGEVTLERVLCLDDHRNFWKRYRNYSHDNCRYFSCGEYGDKFDRPHIHFCIYTNLSYRDCLDAVRRAWSYSVPSSTPLGYGVFERVGCYKTKRKLLGLVTLSSVNIRRMRYCAKYIVKDTNNSFLVPKFARCSKKLGYCFLTKSSDWLYNKANLSLLVQHDDGKPCAMPRYFRKRIFTKSESDLINLQYLKNSSECPFNIDTQYSKVVQWHQERFELEKRARDACLISQFNLFSYAKK